ncbi:HAD-IIA family hydrolase [Georgenia sp. TF02-10]|uniref:HAD-IIA family hydrolase n=1 Tax=Georgenia sp. TF02-10 TaxID=2917725 RepID=UPI001FA7CD91|nr:HAD-IIA family hydrolase [Georgenia sp. TF02-10]UNX56032.1 HAD-IIA family hydrolase [Georgenia sp. TF02-10]
MTTQPRTGTAPAAVAPTLLGTAEPLATAYDLALMDLDGVCYRGAEPVEHADEGVAAARTLGMRTVFVTNNANRPPATVADQLTGLGIPTRAEEVMTSSQAAAAVLAETLPAGTLVLAVGGAGLREALTEAGFRITASAADRPAAVVQGFAPEVGWAQLTEAAYAIGAGARYVATNLDATLPTERGMAVGNGSLVAAVVSATGVRPVSAGKPQPEIFRQAAARGAGTRPLAVGDRLDTDLAGARAAGIPGLHVLTGVSDARDVLLAAPAERPSYLAVDLRGLAEPHPAPVPAGGGWWSCGAAAARVADPPHLALRLGTAVTELEPETPVTVSLDAWRCLTAAAWAAADAGTPMARQQVPALEVVAPR